MLQYLFTYIISIISLCKKTFKGTQVYKKYSKNGNKIVNKYVNKTKNISIYISKYLVFQ